jgi:hypothetical protein
MPEVIAHTNYIWKLTEKECGLITKAIAVSAGIEGPKISEEEKIALTALNEQLLILQKNFYLNRIHIVDDKLEKVLR